MLGVFLSIALACAVVAGILAYRGMRNRAAEPDYFMPMLTQSSGNTLDGSPADTVVTTRSGRKIRALDLEQIRAAGL